MEFITHLIEFVLHIDKYLTEIIANYGTLTYLILFLIVFCETGLVVTPFLPGDSLLFAAGALAANPDNHLNVFLLGLLLIFAALLGDNVNYQVGRFIGNKAFSGNVPFLKKEYLDKTQDFYEKYGTKTIVYARFVPIVRTFAPFVAGVGHMQFTRYITYCVFGAMLWVTLFLGAGYLFGQIEWIQKNFSKVIIAIILISLLPIVLEYFKAKRSAA